MKVGIQIKSEKHFDIKTHQNFQRLSIDLFEIIKANETKKEIELEVKNIERFYFAQAPLITRRDLARGLRSIAYKIQHGEKK